MGSLGPMEMIVLALIVLLVFGTKKLPDLGAGLGKAIKDFKGAMKETEPKEETKSEEKTKNS